MKQEIKKEIFSYIKIICIAFIVSFFMKQYIVVNAMVPTGSMESTIMTGDCIFINKLCYLFEEPKRGDIISFSFPDDEKQNYLKRIIGLPGEEIEGKEGNIYINGIKLEENYIKEISYMDFGPYDIPPNSYFTMGDNRNVSYDARYWKHKFVTKDKIIGKVMLKYFPKFKIIK